MDGYNKKSKASILEHARQLLGNSIKDLYPDAMPLSSGKGGLGQAVEKYHFGYEPNANSEPDFLEAGVELKSTPLKCLRDGNMVSKERLVLNIIDYVEEGKATFHTSSFWKKNQLLLLMFYLHEEGKPSLELLFKLVRYWSFPDTDLKIIQDDWNRIATKIREGKAHEISEGDTLFLGACIKGSKAYENMRTQLVSSAPKAQQRAYSLKSVYLNTIIENSIMDSSMHDNLFLNEKYLVGLRKKVEKIRELSSSAVKSVTEYNEGETFEEWVLRQFIPFYGMTVTEIEKKLEVAFSLNSKSFAYSVACAVLGVKTKRISEFDKSGLQLKTIQLEPNGNLKESMSFPNIQYKEIVEEKEWEESFWYSIVSKRFFFVVFRKDISKNKQMLKLEKVFFWGMPINDIQLSEDFWRDTRNKVINNDFSHFLKTVEHPISHIRPKGQDSSDLMETTVGTYEKKMCYWLNRSYVLDILKRQISDPH